MKNENMKDKNKNHFKSWKSKSMGFWLLSITLFITIIFLGVNVKAAACTVSACQSQGQGCTRSFCVDHSYVCNCYLGEGCIASGSPVSYERICYDNTHWAYQGCVDQQHPGGLWGPYACPQNAPNCIGAGQCTSGPLPPCTIDSVSVTPLCSDGDPSKCEQGESISITVSYSGSCPTTSYLQVDAMDENGECSIEKVGGKMQGMNFTCMSSPCTGSWVIPSIPTECKGKIIYAWSAGLYNNSDYQPSHYVAGTQASIPPGFPQNWTFIAEVPISGCYIASTCNTGDEAIFSVSNVTNAHAALDPDNYSYKVCCPGTNISNVETSTGVSSSTDNALVLKLHQQTNAHVQQNTQTGYNYGIKIKKSDGNYATCTYQDTQCLPIHPVCIVSISGETNAHVANCSGTGAYTSKVCCNLSVGGAPQNYSCNWSTYQCYLNATGPYSSLASCEDACVALTQCQITSAGIRPFCNLYGGSDCDKYDKIELNASFINCNNVNKLAIRAENNTGASCEIIMETPSENCLSNQCKGNYTILEVSPECAGKLMLPYLALIYNDSVSIASTNNVAGSFKFNNTVQPPDCNITSRSIVAHCGTNGCETGENITLSASYTGTCPNINKVRMFAHNVSEIGLYMGANCAGASGTCTGNWTITQEVYNLLKGLTMIVDYAWLHNNTGIVAEKPGYVGSFTFAGAPAQLPCNIVDANITAFCGNDGVCNATIDKIRLNITVENVANCLNVNKIEIDASSNYVPRGGLSFSTPAVCNIIMTNMTPIQVQGNRFIANWTVSISSNCAGKTVYATKAKVYNGTNNKIGEKLGEFGNFKFADQVSGCYCIYNNNQYPCGACVEGTPYYCQDVNGIGQIVSKCASCNNCPSGTVCNTQSGQCIGQPSHCHTNQANSSAVNCHGVTLSLCFWDMPRMLNTSYCEACFAVNGIPTSCSDYKNESACEYVNNIDRCGIGSLCSGAPQGATNCYCSWNPSTNTCQLIYTIEQPQTQHCILNIIVGECDTGSCGAGKRDVTYDYSNQTGYTDCTASDTSSCQPCGLVFRPLPFFEWWQVFVVIIGVVIIYALMLRRKSKI